MREELTFGDYIGVYRIIGISDERVFTQSEDINYKPYAVYLLDNDKSGVHSGMYYNDYESAYKHFCS